MNPLLQTQVADGVVVVDGTANSVVTDQSHTFRLAHAFYEDQACNQSGLAHLQLMNYYLKILHQEQSGNVSKGQTWKRVMSQDVVRVH